MEQITITESGNNLITDLADASEMIKIQYNQKNSESKIKSH